MTSAQEVTFESLSAAVIRGRRWKQYAAENGLSGDWRRAHRYSMSRKDLHILYLQQDGRCYLCGDPLPKNLAKAVIDHDHSCCPTTLEERTPGKTSCGLCVRGLACAPCNRLIAAANDDPDRLRRIADNLEVANRDVAQRLASPLPRMPEPVKLEM